MRIRRFTEPVFESLIKICGYSSGFVVLLIIVFLFKEGISFFGSSPVEEGFTMYVHASNPVKDLSAAQIKDVFDQKITNWKALGGADQPIERFSLDELGEAFTEEQLGKDFEFLPKCIDSYMDSLPGSLAFFPSAQTDGKVKSAVPIKIDKITVGKFLSDTEWFPTSRPAARMGVMPLLLGTLLVSFFAIIIALPLGLAAAVYLAEIADERVRKFLKPVIELLAGIPSVVYGFFGLVVIVPLVQSTFNLPVGETALAGSIVLAIMALPTIITVSEDALRTTPRAMKEASLALGASQWQTIRKVVVPYASSGITAAAILGIGRAIGETMAALMVTGNSAIMPPTLLQPVRTIPATIAAELGEAPFGGLHFQALFALGCLLFIITLIISLLVERVSAKRIN
ncbi:MAG: phosphate ABC transporter permease subunit PstC [Saprospiraceae bacterium]|nr:phosphate ABC transporter permease subunit PstC [Saprospiraceae bacterium]